MARDRIAATEESDTSETCGECKCAKFVLVNVVLFDHIMYIISYIRIKEPVDKTQHGQQ